MESINIPTQQLTDKQVHEGTFHLIVLMACRLAIPAYEIKKALEKAGVKSFIEPEILNGGRTGNGT